MAGDLGSVGILPAPMQAGCLRSQGDLPSLFTPLPLYAIIPLRSKQQACVCRAMFPIIENAKVFL
jgi:hypothetical protein